MPRPVANRIHSGLFASIQGDTLGLAASPLMNEFIVTTGNPQNQSLDYGFSFEREQPQIGPVIGRVEVGYGLMVHRIEGLSFHDDS